MYVTPRRRVDGKVKVEKPSIKNMLSEGTSRIRRIVDSPGSPSIQRATWVPVNKGKAYDIEKPREKGSDLGNLRGIGIMPSFNFPRTVGPLESVKISGPERKKGCSDRFNGRSQRKSDAVPGGNATPDGTRRGCFEDQGQGARHTKKIGSSPSGVD